MRYKHTVQNYLCQVWNGIQGYSSIFELLRNTGLQNQDVLFKAPLSALEAGASGLLAAGEVLLDLNKEYPDGTTSLSSGIARKRM
jgi:hypothetical protein